MAAQAPWLEIEPETDGDEERWRVMMAPGEVKVLTLDQIDDLFRLEIIDESTRVWGPQMQGWLPLGVAAGLETEAKKSPVALAPAPVAAPVAGAARSAPPPPPSRSAPPPAPRLTPSVPPSAAQVAAAFAPRSVPPSRAAAPAYEQAYAAPRASSTPPPSALFAPVPAPQLASETLRPMASESDLSFAASRRGGGGGWLIALAVVLGAGVTLYRNGVVRDVARSSGQEVIYGRLEAAVGGPSFGTVRAVEQLGVSSPSTAARPVLPATAVAAETEARTATSRTAEPTAPKTASPSSEPSHGTALRLEDLAPAKPEAPVAPKAPVRLDALPAPVVKHATAAPAHAASPAPRAAKRRSKDASRMYDPLNPDL